jgi:hypothetical protein
VYTISKDSSWLLLDIYVDDLIITGTMALAIGEFNNEMTSLFRMSDLGLSYYIGIEGIQQPGCIKIGKAAYAGKLLDRMGMNDCNIFVVPMEPS